MSKKRRGCWRFLLIAVVVLLGAGFLAYRFLSARVDLAGFLGEGEVASVGVPEGFRVNVFAGDLNGPRFMALGPDGAVYVADRGNDRIVALPDDDGDGRADEVRVFAAGLDRPHSIVFHEGAWYVGVPDAVIRLQDSDGDGKADVRETVVNLPAGGAHTTRTVAFLPDGRMVVSIGSTCNVCEEEDRRRAAIVVYDGPDGGGERLYASGLRNAVGLAVHPQTGQLWASNNGRDFMGDDLPPETVYAVEEDAYYGWPVCQSGDIVDPDLGFPGACDGVAEPVVEMQAHSAPLGITFYDGEMFPQAFRGNLFIAFHGSWNRSVPTGYKVVRLPFEDGEATGQVVDFATGWLDAEAEVASGRPVDVLVGAGGALYVSDDKAGLIYRISYTGP